MKNLENPDGLHFLVNFFGTDPRQTDSTKFWAAVMEDALIGTSIRILGSNFHNFDPHGLTGMFLLSASHASFHTWPEKDGYVVFDFFSCSGDREAMKVMDYLFSRIKHQHVEVHEVKRGYSEAKIASPPTANEPKCGAKA